MRTLTYPNAVRSSIFATALGTQTSIAPTTTKLIQAITLPPCTKHEEDDAEDYDFATTFGQKRLFFAYTFGFGLYFGCFLLIFNPTFGYFM